MNIHEENPIIPENPEQEPGENPVLPDGPGHGPVAKPLLYAEEDIFRRFEEVLVSLNLRQEITELGCGLNGIFRRGRVLRELNAMCVALWRLALEQSFPEQAETLFRNYLEDHPDLGRGRKRKQQVGLIQVYCELSSEKKIGDFTPLAQYLTNKLNPGEDNKKILLFKLSLTIRKLYQTIFNYLI
ncbi:MAG: hypothetical protein FWF99_01420 [Desulfovibrionaceae bacterium]|nr:hypothetical protein [Desulfovibrionaceae bacterium]